MLFFLIAMRMSGFVFLNPVLGRRNIPAMVKAGLALCLTVMLYTTAESQEMAQVEAESSLMFALLLFKEFALGYLLGFVMQLFDMVMTFAGTVIDFQMGISMAMVYDPQNGGQVALTGNIFQIYFLLLFFAVDGHLALFRILVTSAEAVPYGAVAFSQSTAWGLLDLFVQCVVFAVQMAFPFLAFEFVVQIAVGILTKLNPQINLFVLSIQLKLTIGLILLMFLVSPIGSYIGNMITTMMDTLSDILKAAAG